MHLVYFVLLIFHASYVFAATKNVEAHALAATNLQRISSSSCSSSSGLGAKAVLAAVRVAAETADLSSQRE